MKVTNDDFFTATKSGTFGVDVDGQGSVIVSGAAGYVTIPYNGVITSWAVTGDQSGSIEFDITRSATSIIGGGNKPNLTSQTSNSAAVSSWTSTTVTAGDQFLFNIDSATTVQKAYLVIYITKA